MKVLWICNAPLPKFSKALGNNASVFGGWTVQTLEMLSKCPDVTLGVCFPYSNNQGLVFREIEGVKYWGFNKKNWEPSVYDTKMEVYIKKIIHDFSPDVLHIFGSEYNHALAAAKIFNNPSKTVVHIQGLVSKCAEKYYSFLPEKVIKSFTFRDFIRKDNIVNQKKKFAKRGKFEIELLQYVSNVMGRTNWDKAATYEINPNINYYYCPENLREEFNSCSKWEYENCNKHTVFLSQGSYPIKGLHLAINALAMVVKKYPDTRVYIAGNDLTDVSSFKKKLTQGTYSKYICSLIKKYRLNDNIVFLGSLNANQMIEQFTKANVFVCSSTIENSPNSVLEAMKVGTPVISADVGGVSSMVTDQVEGLLYPADETYVLGYDIIKLFENVDCAKQLSANAIKRSEAVKISDNISILLNVYNSILNKETE